MFRARLFLSVPLLLVIGATIAEMALRFTEPLARSTVMVVVQGELPMRVETRPDADLFWTLPVNQPLDLFPVEIPIHALGSRGVLPDRERPTNGLRILCLGDGTTFGGNTSYPGQLQRVLESIYPTQPIDVMNGGVPSYSSVQGVRFLERWVDWHPDVVTFCFGASQILPATDGVPDEERGTQGSLRVVDALRKSISPRRDFTTDDADGGAPMRVSPTEHRRQLRQIAERCRDLNITLIPLTQPHGLRELADNEEASLVARRRIGDFRRKLDAQNYALRAESKSLGLSVIDLATELETRPTDTIYVGTEGLAQAVQPNPIGARLIAEEIAAYLVEAGPSPFRQEEVPSSRLPRLNRSSSLPVAIAADRDGDHLDELFVATTVDGTARGGWLDPRSSRFETVDIDLPSPDAPFSIAQIPRLRDEVLVTYPLKGGRIRTVTVRASDGSAGFVDRTITPPIPGATEIQVLPVDFEGDSVPEYMVSFGAHGGPFLVFLSQTLDPVATYRVPGYADDSGLQITAGRFLDRDKEHILIGPTFGEPRLRVWGPDRFFEPLYNGRFGMASPPTIPVAGRFSAAGPYDNLAILRFPAISISLDDRGYSEPCFPFGAVRFEPFAISLAAARVVNDLGKEEIWVGSRANGRIQLLRLDEAGTAGRISLSSE